MVILKKIAAMLDDGTRRDIPTVLLLGLGASVLEMVGLGVLPIFVQLLADPDALSNVSYIRPVVDVFGLKSANHLILSACLLLVVFFVLKTLYMVMVYHAQARFMRRVMMGVGNRMFDTYLYAPYTFHMRSKSGDIIRNVTHSPQYFAASLVLPVLKVFLHGVVTLGIIILLGILHPKITLLALIAPAMVAWAFMALIKRATLQHGRILQQALGYITSLTNHALGSIRETHVRGCHDFLRRHFQEQMDRLGAAHEFQKFAPVIAKPVMELFGVIVLVTMIAYFVLQGESLGQALPVIVLFLAAISRLIQNIFPITQSLTAIRTYSHLVELLGNDIEAVAAENDSALNHKRPSAMSDDEPIRLRKTVDIRNLSFRYPNSDQDALKDISLTIAHRSAVAFVGASGSGKTTLLDVILGLLTPQRGHVLVDSRDIQSNLRSWQDDIGYIPQTIYLMDESVRQNVAFGVTSDDIDDERVWEVLRIAQIDSFVRALPEGLNTNVGERGVRISGGQRQRIGIARALYHAPDVLVMDEATSALDSVTESAVIEEISRFKECRTVIMVAHRLSTVKYCDILFLLEKGEIVAQGTFEELMMNNRDFQKLANN